MNEILHRVHFSFSFLGLFSYPLFFSCLLPIQRGSTSISCLLRVSLLYYLISRALFVPHFRSPTPFSRVESKSCIEFFYFCLLFLTPGGNIFFTSNYTSTVSNNKIFSRYFGKFGNAYQTPSSSDCFNKLPKFTKLRETEQQTVLSDSAGGGAHAVALNCTHSFLVKSTMGANSSGHLED